MAANEQQPDPENAEQDPTQSDADQAEPTDMAASSQGSSQGQSSSTGQQKIKVDKYADGFSSEDRYELELDVAPTLALLKKSLETAGDNVREVVSDPAASEATASALSYATEDLKTGSDAVLELKELTYNTPYAFVGLRLESIRAAEVQPAQKEVMEAIETQDDEERLEHASVAWNHISRALGSIGKLEEKYDQVKRQLKRADDILEFKKIYRIYVEKAMKTLGPSNSSINGQNRKPAEFELDEEYLARLKEVLEMQRDMRAELARILADDPQLLRRYMNGTNRRANTIRDQLTLIAYEQEKLSQRVLQWSDATAEPLELASHKLDELESHLAEIEGVANRFFDVQNEFVSWLPLVESAENGEAADAVSQFKTAGVGLTKIMADVETIFTGGGAQTDATDQIEPLLSKSTEVEKQLSMVARTLRQLNKDSTDPEIINNTARRVPPLQAVQRDMQLWAGKLELLGDDLIHEVYSVDQETQRDQLLKYSVKLASLESQLLSGLGQAFKDDSIELPPGVADKVLKLQKMVDVEIPSAQLLAAQALLDGDAQLANLQQQEMKQDFETAERTFDEILQAIVDELDKLPVQDPIASLLEDPTLDEILAQLEREQDLFEDLGISGRPSNLRTLSMGRGGFAGGMASMMSRLQQMRRLSNRAYRRALERARVSTDEYRKPKLAQETLRWNVLVGQLGDAMLQGDNRVPPERYRRAIEQYTDQISKLNNDQQEGE